MKKYYITADEYYPFYILKDKKVSYGCGEIELREEEIYEYKLVMLIFKQWMEKIGEKSKLGKGDYNEKEI